MISVKTDRKFTKLDAYLKKLKKNSRVLDILNKYGDIGVKRLSAATPVETGLTSKSWGYEIEQKDQRYSIKFYNSNVKNGVNIAIILQYGHGTRNGGYVQGTDYINPAVKQTFEEMTNELTKEVGRL